MKSQWEILIVDDEEVMCESLAAWLREDGYRVDTAFSGRQALELAGRSDYAIYFIDLKMPGGMDGIETMMNVRKLRADASVIIITAYATVDTAITAMKEGAQEYIVKPCNPEEISLLVKRIIKVKNLQRENIILRKKLTRQYVFQDIISKNPRMQEIFQLIRDVSSLRSTVLIQGESGTGKELIARAVHFSGERSTGPFVGVSCAALAETLLESELFGHVRGSFTGAIRDKQGKFLAADGGTIFLDEIATASPALQVKLLRVLQDREFKRVGGTEDIRVDVRIISATNKDLEAAVREKRFREDLFYRLNVIQIKLPPLRERREDIPVLAAHFLKKYSDELNKNINKISPDALHLLLNYGYPGNVRELQNIIERAVALGNGQELVPQHLNSYLEEQIHVNKGLLDLDIPSDGIDLEKIIEDIERALLLKALDRTKGIKKKAAELLRINFRSMRYRLEKYGLDNGGDEELS